MTGIILDERKYALKRIEKNDMGGKNYETLICMIKFYRDEGYKKSDAISAVLDFIKGTDSKIDIHKWESTVERYVSKYWKSPTVRLESIPVTQEELDIVNSLPSLRYRRFMFALICFTKFADISSNSRHGWLNRKFTQVFQNGNVHIAPKEQNAMLYRLKEMGLISFSQQVDNLNIKVNCLDYDGKAVIEVDDLRNLGYWYSAISQPELYDRCVNCGEYYQKARQLSNAHKYCKKCAEDITRRNNTNYKRDAKYKINSAVI